MRAAAGSIQTRRASLALNSFDPATRTFSAIAATDKPILRSDPFDGQFYERLLMTPGVMRLQRLQSGRMPILDNHHAASASEQLGIVVRHVIRDGQLVCDGRLTRGDVATPIAESIADGVVCNVSLGYRVFASERSKTSEGLPLITITDWEPIELSFVPAGADPNAYIRNLKGKTMPQARKNSKRAPVRPAPHQQQRGAAGAADVLELELDADDDGDLDIETRGAEAEDTDDAPPSERRPVMSDRNARRAYGIAAQYGLDAAWARRAIEGGVTFNQFRDLVQGQLSARSMERRQSPYITRIDGGGSDETLDNPDFRGTAIRDALLARMTGKPATGPAQQFRSLSLLQMGAELVQMRGERPDWSSHDRLMSQIFTRAAGVHSTSDFANIVANVANKRVLDAYETAVGPWLMLSRSRPASDFKTLTNLRLGEHPALKEVPEAGEIKYVSRAEGKETYRVKTYAGLMALSRQLIINDDAAAFDDMATAQGRAAAETVQGVFVGLFTANSGDGANLEDGSPLYATARGNKAGSGTAIDVTNLGLARKALREMKGLDGVTPIGVTPKHLVVGPAKETQGEQVLATLAAAEVGEQNPFAGKLQLHVEPRFSGNAWRLFADPAQLAVLNHSYLNGQDGPIIDTREGWEVLGVEFRVIMDFGAGLVDFRGTYLNTGA